MKVTSYISHDALSHKEINITAKFDNVEQVLTTITAIPLAEKQRIFSVHNQCPFDVWLGENGASAAQIACTPGTDKNYQSDCPVNQICLNFSQTKNYCVFAEIIEVNATYPQAPIKPSDINKTFELNTSACSGGMVTDESNNVFGQCECSNNNDCGKGQQCLPSAGTNQCQWSLELNDFGKVPTGKYVNIPIEYPEDSKFAASGSMYIKLGCNESGSKCISDNKDPSLMSPTTFIEYTLATTNTDFYDISNINGATIPVSIKPIVSTTTPFVSDENNDSSSFEGNPYWCSVAAGTSDEFKDQIAKIKTANPAVDPQTLLQDKYGCKNDYNNRLEPGQVLVIADGNITKSCVSDDDCKQSSVGSSCGITNNVMMNNLDGNNTLTDYLDRSDHYQCGHIIGYASLTQLCGIAEGNASFGYFDSKLGIQCSTESNTDIDFTNYALCAMKFTYTDIDTGPARSCFNANQTAEGDTCCGYSSWDGMPTGEKAKQAQVWQCRMLIQLNGRHPLNRMLNLSKRDAIRHILINMMIHSRHLHVYPKIKMTMPII